jgi:hypothetical protein
MESIPSLVLGVGRYVIGADGDAGDWNVDPFRLDGQTITTIPEVTYGQSLYSAAGSLGFPTFNFAPSDNGYQGPTFGAAAVPEPGTLALLGLSLAGLAAARRRKQ